MPAVRQWGSRSGCGHGCGSCRGTPWGQRRCCKPLAPAGHRAQRWCPWLLNWHLGSEWIGSEAHTHPRKPSRGQPSAAAVASTVTHSDFRLGITPSLPRLLQEGRWLRAAQGPRGNLAGLESQGRFCGGHPSCPPREWHAAPSRPPPPLPTSLFCILVGLDTWQVTSSGLPRPQPPRNVAYPGVSSVRGSLRSFCSQCIYKQMST